MPITPTLLYRISSALLLLLAAGLVLGLIKLKAPQSVSVGGDVGREVGSAKARVSLRIGGKAIAFAGIYGGFGLCLMTYLFLSAYFAWHLGTMARQAPAQIGKLGWLFWAVQVASLVLTRRHINAFTFCVSGLVALLLAWAAWTVG